MAEADLSVPLVPAFDVRVDGTRLPEIVRPFITDLVVDRDLELPGMFSLTLGGADRSDDATGWLDDRDLFDIGSQVEVSLGFGTELEPVMEGDVVSLDGELAFDRRPSLTVRGYDRMHRLQRGRRTRTFVNVSDGDIVRRVASDAGLTPRIDDPGEIHAYVVQAHQTDLEFLSGRARRLHYMLQVKGRELIFEPFPAGETEVARLAMGEHLLEFRPTLSAVRQEGEARVRGWDPAKKEDIVGTARPSDVATGPVGPPDGPDLAEDAFGASRWSEGRSPVATSGEADALARALLRESTGSLVDARGIARGRTDLVPGAAVEIEEVGRRFGGRYELVSVRHEFSLEEGWYTHFRARKETTQ